MLPAQSSMRLEVERLRVQHEIEKHPQNKLNEVQSLRIYAEPTYCIGATSRSSDA